MSVLAKLYIAATISAAVLFLSFGVGVSRVNNLGWLLFYGAGALFAAGLKVKLPGISGTMSVSYVFVLAGISELSVGEALLIAALATVLQSVWHAQSRPRPIHLVFNVSSVSIAVTGAFWIYHHIPTLGFDPTVHYATQLALASGTYFALNTVSIAGVVALTEGKNIAVVWRTAYFWMFPYYLIGASITALMRYLYHSLNWKLMLFVLPVVYLIFRSYRLYLGQLERERIYANEMAALHLRTIEALALAIETKDHTTGTHLRRVQVYAQAIGQELNFDENQMKALQAASILHDIGKLAVPDYIISKPGKLTPEEFEKMKIHPVVGAEILATINFPYPVEPMVRCHHEKWDGSGYPDGIRGADIPLGARILSCVDCFDALASDRQYRKALPLDKAIEVVKSEAGKAFDPAVVEILARRYLELEKVAAAEPLVEMRTLSMDVKIARGESPDAGFQAEAAVTTDDGTGKFVNSLAVCRHEIQALCELTKGVGASLSLEDKLSLVAARIKRLVPYDSIAVYLMEGGTLVPRHVNGDNHKLFATLRIPLGEGLAGWVAENRKPILNGNPSVEPGYLNDAAKFSTLRSALAVPIESATGILGVIGLYKAEKDGFSRDHLRTLLAINSKVSTVVAHALQDEKTRTVATADSLTGLPNATSLFLRLEEELAFAREESTQVGVMVCDLDGFQRVNDHYGRLAGDRVLRSIGRHLSLRAKSGDYAARMGANQFVVIFRDASAQAVHSRVQTLVSAVCQAVIEICGEAVLGVSVGSAFYPEDGANTESLLAASERRMSAEKMQHKRDSVAVPVAMELARLGQSIGASTPVRVPQPF
jgi:diguanylate cyclase (GGDEF)-like protein/putative nucleotidyltransferase with HDIG domain